MRSAEIDNIFHMLVDSQKGYAEAADIADSPRIAELFAERARDRQDFVNRFTAVFPAAAAERDEGTTAGAAHRLFINLRRMVQDDTKVALAEVERGESAFLEALENALEDDELVGEERQMVSELYDDVLADRDQFAEMKAMF
jgi:uncharacterized protein (TIGR02284 family)